MGKVEPISLKDIYARYTGDGELANRTLVLVIEKLNSLIRAHNEHIETCEAHRLPLSIRQRKANEPPDSPF